LGWKPGCRASLSSERLWAGYVINATRSFSASGTVTSQVLRSGRSSRRTQIALKAPRPLRVHSPQWHPPLPLAVSVKCWERMTNSPCKAQRLVLSGSEPLHWPVGESHVRIRPVIHERPGRVSCNTLPQWPSGQVPWAKTRVDSSSAAAPARHAGARGCSAPAALGRALASDPVVLFAPLFGCAGRF
jgi:hypothetical protein